MTRIRSGQAGLSLVELMVSITLGLMVLSGVLVVFSNTSKTRNEIEKTSRQIENGSFATQLLSEDLRLAGYLGEKPSAPAAPGALPDPCATDLATLMGAMGVHVQGYNGNSGGLTCLTDVKAGTDVLVIRRAAGCASANFTPTVAVETNCDALTAGYTYLQVSGCGTDTAPAVYGGLPLQTLQPFYNLATDTSTLTLRKIGCTNPARILRWRTHIYFIANNNIGTDGIPTLKRWELGEPGTGIVPMVEGVESMQLQYGRDTNNDGVPDSYTSAPASVADWTNVTAVKLHLLARNTAATPDYTDTKTYTLGDYTVPAFSSADSHYKRHVFSTTVRLANPAGRRM